jgi:UDP-N-acetylmuramoyl-tripeptide--D-alanyl-D-alanine ligase
MQYLGTMDIVAQEELTAANFSKLALINRDDIDGDFAKYLTNANIDTYGTTGLAEYRFEQQDFDVEKGYSGTVIAPEFNQPFPVTIRVVGEHSLRPTMGAVAVAAKLGMSAAEIAAGLAEYRSVPGRMNILHGIDDTIIIDDSYNSGLLSASSALQTLYGLQAPQRIAILGTMNELGASSAADHEKLGQMCDASLLAWVVTVGGEAEKYLAPAARARGCQVKSFKTAIEAGAFVRQVTEPGAAILAKGSQGDVYLEEAVKVLCLMDEDTQLVRQSPEWLKIKEDFFSHF